MSRRIARSRLYELNKVGEELTSTAGPAMSGNIGTQSRLRQGELITTDITIDLASSNGAAHSFGPQVSASAGSLSTITIVVVSSSIVTHGNAQIIQLNATSSGADGVGVITGGELMCVEAPLIGGITLGVYAATNASGSGADMLGGGVALAALGAQVVGKNTVMDPDVDIDNKYLYLVHSGAADANYTAGKFVLRLYGYNVFDDV